MDDPNGKHDGKVKGKRYFKCRDKYGYMAPMDSFELFGKSKKKKAKKEKKPKASLDSRMIDIFYLVAFSQNIRHKPHTIDHIKQCLILNLYQSGHHQLSSIQ